MIRSRAKIIGGAFLIVTLIGLAVPGAARAAVIERASVDSAEVQANAQSVWPAISADGRYVAFRSGADNLVPGDTNGQYDIFLRDRDTGTTELISVGAGGTASNAGSNLCSVSEDGRYVAFQSYATNLVAGDTNGVADVFVRDRLLGATVRVSVASDGTQSDALTWYPEISADGKYVLFPSDATNLVPGDTNGARDTFVYDLVHSTIQRVSVDSAGTQANGWSFGTSISADGRYVVFEATATNLVSGDTNGEEDIFVRDLQEETTERVSVSTGGIAGNGYSAGPWLSADGRYVAFQSGATNLVSGDGNGKVDVFVRDRLLGTTSRVSLGAGGVQANGQSDRAGISADGRFVVFKSAATNLVSGDTNGFDDIFVRDRTAGTTTRMNLGAAGAQADGASEGPWVSDDGRLVTFFSDATNLVQGDTNAVSDVFVSIVRTYDSYRGTDRYDTAIKLSQALYPSPLPADSGLVLAPGETFPEALCGAPLAAAFGGPVLLTYKNTVLPNNVRAELQRLAPKTVFCIGLSTTSVNAVIAALPGATVTPINGVGTAADITYDMSRKVANALETKVGDMTGATGIVTRGDMFPDAIGVSPLACAKLWPIILTNSGGAVLHASAAATIADLGLTQTIKVGTYATMPAGVTGLANLSGADRYATNANVATWAKNNAGLSFTHIGIATGDKFPDALASGPYLAADDGILLLSPLAGPLPAVIRALITANQAAVRHITFIAMIEPVIGQVKAVLP